MVWWCGQGQDVDAILKIGKYQSDHNKLSMLGSCFLAAVLCVSFYGISLVID